MPAARQEHDASRHPAVAAFERLYREQVDAVTAYFARRSTDPQLVADLTADTFVQAITSYATYDPRRGRERAWVFGIARRVYAAHCEAISRHQDKLARAAGRRDLEPDQVDELVDRIDAERDSRRLLDGLAETDRAVVELVDLAGLRAREAAAALGISAGAVRMRLMRVRKHLRTAFPTNGSNDHD